MILIGISGKKGSGKDLLASFLKSKYGFVNIPFAQELKAAVRKDFNLTLEHTDGSLKESRTQYQNGTLIQGSLVPRYWTPREIMIAYGQFFRQFDKDYWVKKTFDKIQAIKMFQLYGNKAKVSISDVRFRNEADYIKNQGGYLIRLERKPELNIYKEQSTDLSETDLDKYQDFDRIVTEDLNIIPDDLRVAADNIMNQIGAVSQ